MCVIVVKKQDKKFPGMETLKNCWTRNPDGAGFMFAKDGEVHIRKGFMTWTDFWSELTECRDVYGDLIPYVMHFRIATHGKVSPQCCHPFPLSGSVDDMRVLEFDTHTGIAHNGIIPNRATNNEVSDTMDYISSFVYPLSELCEDWTTNPMARKLIDDTLCSKLAILDGDGSISLFGSFERYDGCLFSNDSYTAYRAWTGYESSTYVSKVGQGWSKPTGSITSPTVDDELLSPYQLFPACDSCMMFDDCSTYGTFCQDANEAVNNCVFDEELFSLE